MVVGEIGYFGDARLARNGALLLERMHERQNVCLRTLAGFEERHRFELDLTARPGRKRTARKATIAVRYGPVCIRRPRSCSDRQASPEIELFAIEAREIDPPPGQKPILWQLLTTHRVDCVEKAVTVIGWYRRRWDTEQLFRTLKQQGLRLEHSVVENGEALEKLAAMALIAAATTMQLVAAHGGRARRSGQPRLHPSTAHRPCRLDRDLAAPHVKATQPLSSRQPRLLRMDHRSTRRMDRIPKRQVKWTHHHARRPRTLPCYRRRIQSRNATAVLNLAQDGEGF